MLLLASRVPHLQGHLLAIDGQRLGFKVSANGSLCIGSLTCGKLVDKCCLTHADIAEKDDLCEELLLMRFNH